jgi:hypothetical protein
MRIRDLPLYNGRLCPPLKSKAQKPGTRSQMPDAVLPEASDQEPAARDQQPAARYQKPEYV